MIEHKYFGMEVHIDFESRSPVAPGDVGLYNYIFHPETEPLFLWYRIGKGEYKLWRIWEDPAFAARDWTHLVMPTDLHAAIIVQGCSIVAYNSAFERYMLKKLGWDIPVERFIDPQVGGRYLSLPASLEVQGQVLGLPPSLSKDARGEDYIKLFSEQVVEKKTKKNPNPRAPYYNDWASHPEAWLNFLEYGRRDVAAEGELLRRQRMLLQIPTGMPLPELERKIWIFDQKVNDTGMPVDVEFVKKLYAIALQAKDEAKKTFEEMTGVKNANSPAQIKVWAATQGYPYPSLNKDTVTSALKDPNLQLTPLLRSALTLRREAASTSYQKLGKILEMVSPDGRLRNQFIFMGSSRCGRWSGNAVQLHNMARPLPITVDRDGQKIVYDFEDQAVVKEARAMIHRGDYAAIKTKYGTPLLLVKNLIRTVFVAPGRNGQ